MKNFVGSKGGSGIAQWIISEMPVHRTYVECFLGKGVILKTKLPASRNIGIELDPETVSGYWESPKPDPQCLFLARVRFFFSLSPRPSPLLRGSRELNPWATL